MSEEIKPGSPEAIQQFFDALNGITSRCGIVDYTFGGKTINGKPFSVGSNGATRNLDHVINHARYIEDIESRIKELEKRNAALKPSKKLVKENKELRKLFRKISSILGSSYDWE